ncbi:MAG: hypothetical protein V1674_00360 [Candidatus Omnitrophota bacterium]
MIKERLNRLPERIRSIIHTVSDYADKEGLGVYLVGGMVRDILLGKENYDLDFVVEGDAIRFAESISEILDARTIKHQHFGTATSVLPNKQKIDFATARSEYYEAPGELPIVKAGTIEDDLFRRDFSINAMAIQINKKYFGRLLDFYGGQKALRKKYVCVLHNLSFLDDPTRILRAVRFEQRFGFKIEPQSLLLIKQARRLRITNMVTKHRLRDEIILILQEKNPIKVLRRLEKIYGLTFIQPRIRINKKTINSFRKIQDTVSWFYKNNPKKRMIDSWLMYLSCLVEHLPEKELKRFLADFAFGHGQEKRIFSYKKSPALLKILNKDLAPSRIFRILEPLSYEVVLLLYAKANSKTVKKNTERFFKLYNGTKLFISGDDLNKLGLAPGPRFKKLLDMALKAKLDGRLTTKLDEINFIKRKISA